MGTNETTNTTRAPQQMRPAELSALADRLRNRADSVLLRDQPEMQRDLHAAAVVIEQLANLTAEVLASAAVIDGLTRLLDVMGGA